MDNTTHNGWTNYATWRVNLECFDGRDSCRGMSAEECEDVVTTRVCIESEGLAVGYALLFLSDVNWHEIAEHLSDEEE